MHVINKKDFVTTFKSMQNARRERGGGGGGGGGEQVHNSSQGVAMRGSQKHFDSVSEMLEFSISDKSTE